MSSSSPPPQQSETDKAPTPPLLEPLEEELLDAPNWLGQPGYESRTKHWFSLAEQSLSDDEMEDIQNPFSDVFDLESYQYHRDYESIEQFQPVGNEKACSHLPSIWDSSSEEAEVPASFYLPPSPYQTPLSIQEQQQVHNQYKRIADCQAEIATKKRRLANTTSGSFSSRSSHSEFPHSAFHPPGSPPPFTVSSSPSWTSRSISPQAGFSRRHAVSFTFCGNEQQQLLLFSQAQMNAEYEDIARGPISNKEFLKRLKMFDEDWNMPYLSGSDISLEYSSEPPVLWKWWAAYLEAFPHKAKDMYGHTVEASEVLTMEIQDEYFECERAIDEQTRGAFRQFEKAVGEEGIVSRVLEVAQIFQDFVKGKYREGTLDDRVILLPEFEEGELPASHELVAMLPWHYQCKNQFFEGRYPAWLLGAVRTLVDYGKLEVGDALESLIGSSEDSWTVWPEENVELSW